MKWLVLGLAMTACTHQLRDATPPRDLLFEVWDGRTGQALSMDEVNARLAAVDVVLVGEEHGQRDFQATELEVARVAHAVGFTTLAVEWITWAARDAIAHSTSATVQHDLDWAHTWGHDFDSYRDIFTWAFAQGVPVVGVNARPELARALAKGGRDAVPAELASELTPLDSGFQAQRTWFWATMVGAHHPMPADALERYYLAQLLWDETMALHIDALADTHKVVAFAGLGHTQRALGIAHRLKHHVLIVRPVADATEARRFAHDVDYPERDADLLWRLVPPRNQWVVSASMHPRQRVAVPRNIYPRSTNTASR